MAEDTAPHFAMPFPGSGTGPVLGAPQRGDFAGLSRSALVVGLVIAVAGIGIAATSDGRLPAGLPRADAERDVPNPCIAAPGRLTGTGDSVPVPTKDIPPGGLPFSSSSAVPCLAGQAGGAVAAYHTPVAGAPSAPVPGDVGTGSGVQTGAGAGISAGEGVPQHDGGLSNELGTAAIPTGAAAIPTGAGVIAETVAQMPRLSVYFDTGRAQISTDFERASQAMLGFVGSHPTARLSVSGYNDPRGNAALNAELSKNRAQAVKAALVARGVPADRIDLDRPAATTQGQGNDANARRVDVTVKGV